MRSLFLVLFVGLTLLPKGDVYGQTPRQDPDPGVLSVELRSGVPFASSYFTAEWKRAERGQAVDGAWWGLGSGLAVSYGLSERFGIVVDWLSGWTFASGYTEDENARRQGPANLRIAVPILLVSEMRASGGGLEPAPRRPPGRGGALIGLGPVTLKAAPVGVIDIPGYDMDVQAERFRNGSSYVAEPPDVAAHALGMQLSQRMSPVEQVRVEAGQEFLYYFPADYEAQSLDNYQTNVVRSSLADADAYETIYYRFGLRWTIGGWYFVPTAAGHELSPGLFLEGRHRPRPVVDDILVEDTDSHLVSITPRIRWTPPLWGGRTTFSLGAGVPLFGKNSDAAHELSFAVTTRFLGPYAAGL